eukprot:CAMPEP_0181522954 /NCGR_PEP_ID=MMETSP1110-20121109/67646_1 /TAXON_ID=174948 /ORGANISM="Symbiodinium sp., Strain CCMP421" /LENGTH=150 /DNA_ID=CAMNT_0023653599 /DNA_START=304 /DNA_END=754 /DNA_ORIENTATION=+
MAEGTLAATVTTLLEDEGTWPTSALGMTHGSNRWQMVLVFQWQRWLLYGGGGADTSLNPGASSSGGATGGEETCGMESDATFDDLGVPLTAWKARGGSWSWGCCCTGNHTAAMMQMPGIATGTSATPPCPFGLPMAQSAMSEAFANRPSL